jgi:hypothetical protein
LQSDFGMNAWLIFKKREQGKREEKQ